MHRALALLLTCLFCLCFVAATPPSPEKLACGRCVINLGRTSSGCQELEDNAKNLKRCYEEKCKRFPDVKFEDMVQLMATLLTRCQVNVNASPACKAMSDETFNMMNTDMADDKPDCQVYAKVLQKALDSDCTPEFLKYHFMSQYEVGAPWRAQLPSPTPVPRN